MDGCTGGRSEGLVVSFGSLPARRAATFFMIGEAVAAHPEIVEAVARGRHTVANHTHSHPPLPYLSAR